MHTKDHSGEAVILLAEDRPDDIALVKQSFAMAGVKNRLYVVQDGDEVLGYLKADGRFWNRELYPLPDLLVLDLQLPRRNGFEVLEWIRSQPELKTLRIIVLTYSCDVYEISRAYELGASSFLTKPGDLEDRSALQRTLARVWPEEMRATA